MEQEQHKTKEELEKEAMMQQESEREMKVLEETRSLSGSSKKVDFIPLSDNKKKKNEEWIEIPLESLPGRHFYPNDFVIQIRPASIKEIKEYSVIREDDINDITSKLNNIIRACTKVFRQQGDRKMNLSYKHIKIIDRYQIIFYIRDITFQNRREYNIPYTHDECGHEGEVTLNPQHIEYVTFEDLDERIKEFFDEEEKVFVFDTPYRDEPYKFGIPTIGLDADCLQYIMNESYKRKKPISAAEVSFFDSMAMLFPDKTGMSQEELSMRIQKYKKLEEGVTTLDEFEFIQMVTKELSKIKTKGLKVKCGGCGEDIHIDNLFPDGISSLFISSVDLSKEAGNPFAKHIRKS